MTWAIVVFFAAFVTDATWSVFIRSTADGKATMAAVASVFTGALGLFGMTSVVNDAYMAIPWLLGLFCGTYTTIRWSVEKKGKDA